MTETPDTTARDKAWITFRDYSGALGQDNMLGVAFDAGFDAGRASVLSGRPYAEDVDHEYGAWETDDIEEHALDMLAVVARRRALIEQETTA